MHSHFRHTTLTQTTDTWLVAEECHGPCQYPCVLLARQHMYILVLVWVHWMNEQFNWYKNQLVGIPCKGVKPQLPNFGAYTYIPILPPIPTSDRRTTATSDAHKSLPASVIPTRPTRPVGWPQRSRATRGRMRPRREVFGWPGTRKRGSVRSVLCGQLAASLTIIKITLTWFPVLVFSFVPGTPSPVATTLTCVQAGNENKRN